MSLIQFSKTNVIAIAFTYCLLSIISIPHLVAQDRIWGSSQSGFESPGGFIYSLNSDGSDFTIHKDFSPAPGAFGGDLLKLDDGNFMTSSYFQRTLYLFSADGSTFESIPIIGRPLGLVLGEDGYVYGTTTVETSDEDEESRLFRLRQDGSGLEVFANVTSHNTIILATEEFLFSRNQNAIIRTNWQGEEELVIGEQEFGSEFFSPTDVLSIDEDRIYGFAVDFNGNSRYFGVSSDGSNFEYLRVFEEFGNFEFQPTGNLLAGSDGYYYGYANLSGNNGAIFRLSKNGSDFSILHEFSGELPQGSLAEHEGLLFGATQKQVFSLERDGSDFITIFDFDPETEDRNLQSPIRQNIAFDNNDNLLILTYDQIFTASATSTTLDSITLPSNVDGLSPINLVQVGSTFYGINRFGGERGHGTIFKIENNQFEVTYQLEEDYSFSFLIAGDDKNLYAIGNRLIRISAQGADLEVLREFESDNFVPSRIFYKDGYLYGEDGENVFRMDTSDDSFTNILEIESAGAGFNLHLLTSDNFIYAVSPKSPLLRALVKFSITGEDYQEILEFDTEEVNRIIELIESEGGRIFGLYQDDESTSGKLFELDEEEDEFSTVQSFPWFSESLLEGSDGALYGTAGGFRSYLYRIEKDGTNYSEQFVTENSGRLGSIIRQKTDDDAGGGAKGALWGTSFRGAEGIGAIFSIQKDGSNFTVHKDFASQDGQIPVGSLVLGTDGYLYGMARDGGENNLGTIYRIRSDGTSFSVLHNFAELDGSNPLGSLVWGDDNFLYGATSSGGEAGFGTVFRLRPDGEDFEVLKYFDQNIPEEGYGPSELLLANNGDLYGLANGGEFFNGLLFRMGRDGASFTVIRHFDDPDGRYPIGGLIQGSDGYIYGLTEEGGTGRGTAYRINLDGSDFTVLRSFNRNEEGFHPTGKLTEFPDGLFYGVLQHGMEEDGDGSIYRMNADGSDFTVLHNFEFPISSPSSELVPGNDAFLYGMTMNSIYRINPDSSSFEVVEQFTGDYGGIRGLVLVETGGDCTSAEISTIQIAPSPVNTNTKVTAAAAYVGEIVNAVWHWGDGNSSEATLTATALVGTHTYQNIGSYQITLEVTDDCGTGTSSPVEIKVTDDAKPSSGSVKGTGMFSSPRGAYVSKPQVKGMAHYSFYAKAAEGKVTGNFQFKIADLHLRSTHFSQLIIDDNKAWLYGEGKIKGKGKYGFLLAMVDEVDNRHEKSYRKWKARGKDKLRVRIWNLQKDNKLVYDNQGGDSEEAVANSNIERGTIIILEEEMLPEVGVDKEFIIEQLKKIKAYPNPATDRIYIDLGDIDPELINSMLTDAYGTFEIRNLHKKQGGNLLEFDLSSLKHGTYYIRIQTTEGAHSIKILKK